MPPVTFTLSGARNTLSQARQILSATRGQVSATARADQVAIGRAQAQLDAAQDVAQQDGRGRHVPLDEKLPVHFVELCQVHVE